jgi:hypothetical protein
MTIRNLSPQHMFFEMAKEHKPKYHFKGRDKAAFKAWKAKAQPEVMACLGDFPKRVPANPQLLAEWEHGGLRKQRWIIDVGPRISATLNVNIPGDMKRGEKRPAILCWHGHGEFGKDPVMGNDSSPDMKVSMIGHNYSYGLQMAQKGFVTYAIDWIGCGERNDSRKPNYLNVNGSRDWCNVYYLHATMFGMTSISINVMHGMAATDFACTLPFVDGKRLGVMGLSGGGTMTLWSTLCDPRFKASEIICYSDLWAYFGMRDVNYCGMQVAPGLYKLVDLPDAQGLIAPRPLLVDIAAYDTCFIVDTAMQCYEQVKKIYRAAGAADRLELDFYQSEHAWGGNKSEAFFKKHLGL